MSFRAKRELLLQVNVRYQAASHQQKSIILDEFIAATGYARKYAIRLLTRPAVGCEILVWHCRGQGKCRLCPIPMRPSPRPPVRQL